MFAQLLNAHAARLAAAPLFAALAIAFAVGLGTAAPAGADATQWQRPHSSWNQGGGWNRQWHSQTQRRNQFNSGTRVIIGGGSGVVITGPGLVVGNGFVVRQPGFVIGQPAIVVRKPNIIWERPSFAKKQWAFYQRHPSLRLGQPWRHGNWKHKHWKHKRWHQMGGIN